MLLKQKKSERNKGKETEMKGEKKNEREREKTERGGSPEDWANAVNEAGVSTATKQFALLAGWP